MYLFHYFSIYDTCFSGEKNEDVLQGIRLLLPLHHKHIPDYK